MRRRPERWKNGGPASRRRSPLNPSMTERRIRTIGILGGGQLGRMLSVAASRLGLRTHIFSPDSEPPAGQVADRVTTADWSDAAALSEFASAVDVVTFEFENVPVEAL